MVLKPAIQLRNAMANLFWVTKKWISQVDFDKFGMLVIILLNRSIVLFAGMKGGKTPKILMRRFSLSFTEVIWCKFDPS